MTTKDNQARYSGDMGDVAAICGRDVADALAATLPGLNLWVPSRWSEGHLVAQLDRPIADRLIAAMGGQHIYVSRAGPPRPALRDAARTLKAEGETTQAIALKLGLSERSVYRLIKGAPRARRVDPRQIDLFGGAASPDR